MKKLSLVKKLLLIGGTATIFFAGAAFAQENLSNTETKSRQHSKQKVSLPTFFWHTFYKILADKAENASPSDKMLYDNQLSNPGEPTEEERKLVQDFIGVTMKQWVASMLICPECLEKQAPLELTVKEEQGDDVTEGELICPQCRGRYPITRGVALVLPEKTRKVLDGEQGYNSFGMLSAYLWSHFSDLFEDPDASDAYRIWSSTLTKTGGDLRPQSEGFSPGLPLPFATSRDRMPASRFTPSNYGP